MGADTPPAALPVRSAATVHSGSAARYLRQLCRHFAHTVAVETHGATAVLHFTCGRVRLAAEADRLEISVRSADAEGLRESESVIERHLVRFAFRESVAALAWRREP